jgi:TIR domain
MKPAERIPLLKKLATALSDEEAPWSERELVLRQFGFRCTDDREWENGYEVGPSLYEVVLSHLENSGTDEGLLELERYLDPADGEQLVPASAGPGPWKNEGSFRIFISHTHPNAAFAAAIKKHLEQFSIESFVAHNDIEPSEKWMRVIESALLTCHAAIALMTPDFRESKWCDQEVGFCLARSLLVVPLMHGPDPHGFLSEVQGVKLRSDTSGQSAATDVLRILASRDKTRDRMAPSVVRFYAASKNFESTRQAFTLLTRIPKEAWTPEMVHEVERAAKDNYQVKAANLRTGTPVSEAASKLLAPIKRRLEIDEPVAF